MNWWEIGCFLFTLYQINYDSSHQFKLVYNLTILSMEKWKHLLQ